VFPLEYLASSEVSQMHLEASDSRHHLSSKVVSRRCMAHPRSCSLRPDLHFIATAPPGCSDVSDKFLCSAWCKDVDALHGRIGCHE
jgi:hypothetical protein